MLSVRTIRTVITIGVLVVAGPAAARAQSVYSDNLATLIPNFLTQSITLASGAPANTTVVPNVAPPHDAHFNVLNDRSLSGPAAAATAAGVNRALASQMATFPLGSSSGGFTWRFDETLGASTRTSQSFGPQFAERAYTAGQGRLNLAFGYQHTSFSSFEGLSLDDGSLRFYLPHTDCCPAGAPTGLLNLAFEGDVIEAAMRLEASSDIFTVAATYGVTDRWDVGVALPFVHIDIEATLDAEIFRFSTQANPRVHEFPGGASTMTTSTNGSATGIGDIILRTKYAIVQAPAARLAAALDLRLPSGDADNLLGTGTTQGKIYAVLSTGNDRFSQHVNIGFTMSGEGSLDRYIPTGLEAGTTHGSVTVGSAAAGGNAPAPIPLTTEIFGSAPAVSDEFNFAGGVEYAVNGRLTIIGDLIGRTLFDAGDFEPLIKTVEFNTCLSANNCAAPAPGGPQTASSFQGRDLQELTYKEGNVNLLYGTAGVKFNPAGNWLIGGSILFPLTDSGLRSKVTTVVGVEYAF
jgi:hypothetical protein